MEWSNSLILSAECLDRPESETWDSPEPSTQTSLGTKLSCDFELLACF